MKGGQRKYKFRAVQQFVCCFCGNRFTLRQDIFKGRKYGEACIVKAISLSNLGHSLAEVRAALRQEFGESPGKSTIGNWLADFSEYYSEKAVKTGSLSESHLNHCGRYKLQVHHGKLEKSGFSALNEYLTRSKFNEDVYNTHLGSCSTIKAECESTPEKIPDSRISRFTGFALSVPHRNYQRHEIVSRYLLVNDAQTVATEVPVHLKKGEIDGLNADLASRIEATLRMGLKGDTPSWVL